MGLTFTVITITVVASVLAAAVFVVAAGYLIMLLVDRSRRRRALRPLLRMDAEYRATRRAMYDAADKSYRNLID